MKISRKLPPLATLRAFEAAARHLSFQKAATELSVTPTAISHQIRLLESSLGLPLFERHIRRVSLTNSGLILFPVLRDGFDAFEQAVDSLYPRETRQAVTITATTLFTARKLIPALGEFRADNPNLELRLHASDEVLDLRRGVADVAVRYEAKSETGLIAETLCQDRFGIVCSPTLGIEKPADLLKAPLLHVEWQRDDLQPSWRRWCTQAGISHLDTETGLRFTDDSHAIQAAIAGHGVAIASIFLLQEELARGLLIQPFGPTLDGGSYHFVTTQQNADGEEVQAVRSWLKALVQETA